MAAPKRTRFQRELDLARIAAMYLKQKTQTEIAQELGLVQSVISRDLAEVKRRWRESALVDLDEAQQRELARIDNLEREYWDAWQRSIGEVVKTTTSKSDKDGNRASIVKEVKVGDPAYLAGAQWCIEQRCKIFGVYEATKLSLDWRKAVEEQGLDAGRIFEQMVEAYIKAVDPDAD